MIGSDAIQLMRFRLARFSPDVTTLTDAMILAEMNAAQIRMEREVSLPFFLISEEATEQTVPFDERVQLPDRFIRELEVDSLWIIVPEGSKKISLGPKMPLDSMRERYPVAIGSGAFPKTYAILGNYFRLGPIPDAVYSIKMIYYKKDAAITLVDENRWLANEPDMILAETGQVLAMLYLRDEKAGVAMAGWKKEIYDRRSLFEITRASINLSVTPED